MINDNLADVSLLEYLREDNRPTVVFGDDVNSPATAGSQWALAYSNPAFDQFLTLARKLRTSLDSDYAAFTQAFTQADYGRFDFAGHRWRVRYFLTKWKVVFCEDELDGMLEQSDALSSPEPLPSIPDRSMETPTPTRGSLPIPMQHRSDSSSSGDTTPGNSTTRALSKKSSTSIFFGEARELIDWTQYDVPNLSPYIQFFKNFDWTSTPFGPMKDWPMVLRQVVVKMMSNPGRCGMYCCSF